MRKVGRLWPRFRDWGHPLLLRLLLLKSRSGRSRLRPRFLQSWARSPPSKSASKAKNPLGGSAEQPLAVMPITVWNPPTESVRSPPRQAEELKRKAMESKIGEDGGLLASQC